MKRGIPYIIIGLLLGLLILSQCQRKKDQAIHITNSSRLANQIEQLRTEKGEWVTKAQTLEVEKKDLIREYKQALKAVPKTKIRTVKQFVEVRTVVRDTIILKGGTDTITQKLLASLSPGPIWTHNDKWMDLSIDYDGLFFSVGYELKDSLSMFETIRRPLFKPTIREFTVVSNNPNSKVNALRHTVIEQKRRWGLGIYGGYGFNGRELSPYIGLGFGYNLLTF